jgi:beta-1,4-N-acetylglucosaminyltransferase
MLRVAELFEALVVALVVVLWRVWVALPRRLKSQDASGKRAQEAGSARTSSAKTLVVLGSGGHTSEMVALLRGLLLGAERAPRAGHPGRYAPLVFVLSATDKTSLPQMRARGLSALLGAEGDATAADATTADAGADADAKIVRITRAREVGQRWGSSALTSARACAEALRLVWRERPELVLCNGPGVCVPICLAAFLLRALASPRYRPKIVFCESFCRVSTLSLTGKIMYHVLADRFVVHWPALQKRFPKSEYVGNIY